MLILFVVFWLSILGGAAMGFLAGWPRGWAHALAGLVIGLPVAAGVGLLGVMVLSAALEMIAWSGRRLLEFDLDRRVAEIGARRGRALSRLLVSLLATAYFTAFTCVTALALATILGSGLAASRAAARLIGPAGP